MPSKNSEIDDRLATGLSGQEKLRTLMKAKAGSVSRWAVDQGFIPEQVFMATSGVRPYPEIREAIVKHLELSREEVDRLIDGNVGQPA